MWCGGLVCGRLLVRGLALWLLPTCRRWFGCPFVLDRVREIEPVLRRRPVEQPHDASHAELLIVSSRRLRFARWAAHLPVKRASGFLARRTRERRTRVSLRLGRDRSERQFIILACGPGRLAALQFGPLALRRAPQRARNRVDAASNNPSYRRAKFCRERQRGRRSPLLPGAGQHRFSHLAAPRDAARLAWVPQR